MDSLLPKIRGAVYGHLLGDALGVPYEDMAHGEIDPEVPWTSGGLHGQPRGTYSDDGALVLCQADALLAHGEFDTHATACRFMRWWLEGFMAAGGKPFDIGRTTEQALMRLRSGVPLDAAGGVSEFDNGNGSLLRILPLGLWYLGDSAEGLTRQSFAASAITHQHARSKVACALHNLLLQNIWKSGFKPGQASLGGVLKASIAQLHALIARWPHEDVYLAELEGIAGYTTRSGSSYVLDSFWCAIDSVAAASNFSDAVRAAVRYGQDTDTTAAIAGGIAGFVFGEQDLPVEWLNELRLDGDQRDLVEAFANQAAQRALAAPSS